MTILTPVESQRNLIEDTLIDYPLPPTSTLFKSMAAGINEIVKSAMPIGTVVETILNWTQFTQIADSNDWCAVDGQNISGSLLSQVGGFTNSPDTRGRFLRAKSLTSGNNPDGDLAVGSYTADKFKSHTHSQNLSVGGSGPFINITSHSGVINENLSSPAGGLTATTLATGGNETAPKAVHIYHYLRIN